MFPTLLVLSGVALGQPDPGAPPPPPLFAPVRTAPGGELPPAAARPAPFALPPTALEQPTGAAADPPAPPAAKAPDPVNVQVTVPPPPAPAAPAPAPAAPPDRWEFMRDVQGTWLGVFMDDRRMSFSGWTEMSYTGSTATENNQPVVWNDRANRFLVNQFWLRFDRSVVTSGTTDTTYGYRLDILSGSDYRFTQQRGLFDQQLVNPRGNQNIYGVDPIQFYANAYLPTLFRGTDIRVGRLFTPWGYESLEGVSTPFVSRSYAFNWSPPFTHMGIQVSPTFSSQWSGKFMLANGNDVFITSVGQEARGVGAITWTSLDKADTATFGYSFGRGAFNSSYPNFVPTLGEQNEPAGRNNINVLDFVYTHIFSTRFNYAAELIYGYQTGVPSNATLPAGGGLVDDRPDYGTAHWGSVVQYFNYNFTDKLIGITRFELFDDFQGQRTGYKGLYEAITVGAQYRPVKDIMIRPELRYDNNGYSLPFEGKHSIFTAAIDVTLRF